ARFYRRQPAPNLGRTRAHCASQIASQWVVAAGVEKDDVGGGRPLHCPVHEPRRTISQSRASAVSALASIGTRELFPATCRPWPAYKNSPTSAPRSATEKSRTLRSNDVFSRSKPSIT